jgi:3-phosphoshikimate 1-carboxyvinyltransferase
VASMAGGRQRYNPRVRQGGSRAMGLRPGGVIAGVLRVPGSKSLAQRALVCASLAEGATEIAGLPDGDDAGAALTLVEAAGARVERLSPGAVRVTGRPPGPDRGWSAKAPVSAGESGTLARLATAALALCGEGGPWHELRGEGTLLRRRSPPLFDALAGVGVGIEWLSEAGGWPVRLRAIRRPDQVDLRNPVSSQEVSALLVALAAHPGETVLFVHGEIPSRPYVDLTRNVLEHFRITVGRKNVAWGEAFAVIGPLRPWPHPLVIEPDASAAAVALAAACLSGGEVVVPCLFATSPQGDVRILEHLARFGCRAWSDREGLHAADPPTRGADLDLSGEPDLAPVLAAVAARAAIGAGGSSRLTGLGTLAGKESDRIGVLARGLSAVGLEAVGGADWLEIRPGRTGRGSAEVRLEPARDHRMAFAFALLGLAVEGVWVADPGCVAKSWPGFWRDLEGLGARVVRQD